MPVNPAIKFIMRFIKLGIVIAIGRGHKPLCINRFKARQMVRNHNALICLCFFCKHPTENEFGIRIHLKSPEDCCGCWRDIAPLHHCAMIARLAACVKRKLRNGRQAKERISYYVVFIIFL